MDEKFLKNLFEKYLYIHSALRNLKHTTYHTSKIVLFHTKYQCQLIHHSNFVNFSMKDFFHTRFNQIHRNYTEIVQIAKSNSYSMHVNRLK
jgi:uncharacterized protein YbgA (DUF1722 family)